MEEEEPEREESNSDTKREIFSTKMTQNLSKLKEERQRRKRERERKRKRERERERERERVEEGEPDR